MGSCVAALRLISAGGTFVPADALRSTAAKRDDQPEGERQRRSDGRDLTPRELSVIDLLREGKPNKLIAAIAEGQTIMQRVWLVVLLTLTAIPLSARAACPTEWPLMWIKVSDLAAC